MSSYIRGNWPRIKCPEGVSLHCVWTNFRILTSYLKVIPRLGLPIAAQESKENIQASKSAAMKSHIGGIYGKINA
jgi:hypothetical protein